MVAALTQVFAKHATLATEPTEELGDEVSTAPPSGSSSGSEAATDGADTDEELPPVTPPARRSEDPSQVHAGDRNGTAGPRPQEPATSEPAGC